MRRLLVVLIVVVLTASLALAGCTQAVPSTTYTKAPSAAPAATAPAAPAKPVEPTKAPETASKKDDFPQKGKAITIIVPFGAGGANDSATRLLAPMMEKYLEVPVQVVNKAGASTQVAATELVGSKPDGYTLMMFAIPTTLITYLDPERKATYTRKDFTPVAGVFSDRLGIFVKDDSPFKTVKDVVDAAKANPEKIKVGTAGIMSVNHLGAVAWAQEAGIKFAYVHFNSGTEAITAALGGHLDVATATLGNVGPYVKAGTIRGLGVMDSQESPLLPGVKTFDAQGYKINAPAYYFLTAPAGTPKNVIDVISTAVKKAVSSDEYKKRLAEVGGEAKYMDPVEITTFWAERESWTKPLMEEAKKK